MDYLTKCFTEVKLNCFFYMEFYAAVFGFFFIELITYLIAHYVATENLLIEVIVRVFFSIIHFILVGLFENRLDFYQFRWLFLITLNQCMIMYSVEANPIHSLVLLTIITYPILTILKNIDTRFLKKGDVIEQDADILLPQGGLSQMSNQSQEQQIVKQLQSSILSIILLTYTIRIREILTPDFLHFVTLLKEDYVHMIWVFVLWSIYKCFFIKWADSKLSDKANLFFYLLEMAFGLLFGGQLNISSLTIYSLGITIFLIRNKYQAFSNAFLVSFIFLYFLQNFVVNILDLLLFKSSAKSYYHDEDFLNSFSFKIFQAFLCMLFSLLYSQCIVPSHENLFLAPQLLSYMFYITVPACILMFATFLYELTFEQSEKRTKIFKNELSKVFFTILVFYSVSMIFANWLQSIKSYIKHTYFKREQKQLKQQQYKAKSSTTKVEQEEQDKVDFSFSNFTLSDFVDFTSQNIDNYILNNLHHIRDNLFMNAMRSIQSISAIIFFFLLHIPLSRISSLFSILTSLIPLILQKKNKQDVYLKVNRLVSILTFSQNDISWKAEIISRENDLGQKIKQSKYQQLKEKQQSCINWTVFILGMFISIFFNYIYTIYLEAILINLSEVVIRIFDKLGYEVHFVRLVYLTIFEQKYIDGPKTSVDYYQPLIMDHLNLILIILPMMVIGLKYLTSPINVPYILKYNALLAPILVIPIFTFYHYDILYMAILVLLLNLFIAWKCLDPENDTWKDYFKLESENKVPYMNPLSGLGTEALSMGMGSMGMGFGGFY